MVNVLIAENSTRLQRQQLEFLMLTIPHHLRKQAMTYRRWEDSQAYLLGKFLLATGLEKYGMNKRLLDALKCTPYGRPYLDVPDFDFNISHSGKYVICAISNTCKLGIDIEEIREIEINDFTGQFNEEAMFKIATAKDIYKEFFRHWTRKEAVIKADGRGLGIPINEIGMENNVTLEGRIWFLYEIELNDRYQAHLATSLLVNAENITIERCQV